MYELENRMRNMNTNIAIQGECIGMHPEGGRAIQGNKYALTNFDLYIFSIYSIDTQKYLGLYEMQYLAQALELKTVPILSENIPLVNDIPHYVEASKGKSQLNPKLHREGLVIRAMDSSFSFKAINPDFLLKHEE
jgi:ATP-dependent RNA circularization protein (DNA/RNA ligase family)